MAGGTYTLLVSLADPATVTIGALGEVHLAAGWYGYTGSALGPGGFARLDRHRQVAAGEHPTRHWHIDYLLGHPDATFETAVTTEAAIECAVARSLCAALEPIDGVGCSDCGCGSHLVYAPDRRQLAAATSAAHRQYA